MKNIAKLDHLNLSVKNYQESINWYQKIFGFEVVEEGTNMNGRPYGIIKSEETMIALNEDPERGEPKEHNQHLMNHFGFKLLNKDFWIETLKKFNLKTYYGSPVEYPNSTSWYVKDPTGHEIEVSIWNNNKIIF